MADDETRIARDVVFAGDNPLLMLYAPGTDDVTAVASYWRCGWSAEGAGEALVIWVDPGASGLGDAAPVGIYTDNAPMARMVWETFNRHFEPLQGRGIEARAIQPARFTQQADGTRLHRVACAAGITSIELEWRGGQEVVHMVTKPTVGGIDWEVSNVIVPCAGGSIRVNGVEAVGEVRWPEGLYASSAFLALCESWVRLG